MDRTAYDLIFNCVDDRARWAELQCHYYTEQFGTISVTISATDYPDKQKTIQEISQEAARMLMRDDQTLRDDWLKWLRACLLAERAIVQALVALVLHAVITNLRRLRLIPLLC